MAGVSDEDHVVVLEHVIGTEKIDSKAISVMTSCMAPYYLNFKSKAARDEFFSKLRAKLDPPQS